MAQGDAFNRSEVSSVYVGPKARYIVSLIVGVSQAQANSPESAALIALQLMQGEDRGQTIWSVHDRETGETFEVMQGSFDQGSLVPPSSLPR